jgi:hypothetical protein
MKRSSRRVKQKAALPWPPFLLVGGGLLLALAAFLMWRSQGAPAVPLAVDGAPSLMVDKEKVDLGDVKLGQNVAVSFAVSNAGNQPLRFTDLPYVEVVEGC